VLLAPAGQVTGFGPLNEGVQSAIDRAVDQARAAFTRDGVPAIVAALKRDVVPALISNTKLQHNIGAAAGEAAAKQATVPLYVAAGSLAVLAAVGTYLAAKRLGAVAKKNPRRGR
jgi:hypothetical protein